MFLHVLDVNIELLGILVLVSGINLRIDPLLNICPELRVGPTRCTRSIIWVDTTNVGASFLGHKIPEINPWCHHQPQDHCSLVDTSLIQITKQLQDLNKIL